MSSEQFWKISEGSAVILDVVRVSEALRGILMVSDWFSKVPVEYEAIHDLVEVFWGF